MGAHVGLQPNRVSRQSTQNVLLKFLPVIAGFGKCHLTWLTDDDAMLRKSRVLGKTLGLLPTAGCTFGIVGLGALCCGKHGALLLRVPPHQHFAPPCSEAHIGVWAIAAFAAQAIAVATELGGQLGLVVAASSLPCWVKSASVFVAVYFDALSKRCSLKTDAIGESFLPLG